MSKKLYILIFTAESFSAETVDANGSATSRNMMVIQDFARRSNLLRMILKPQHFLRQTDMTPLYMTVLVTLVHLWFMIENGTAVFETFAYGLSQRFVYASSETQPVVTTELGTRVNMEWVLHLCNFWKSNLTCEGSLGDAFRTLHDYPPEHQPRGCSSMVAMGTSPLGKRWINAYGESTSGMVLQC